MMFKPLAYTMLAASVLTACSPLPVKENKQSTQPYVFTEPDISPPFYSLNPFNYDAPPAFEVALKEAAAQPVTKMVVKRSDDPTQTIVLDVNKLIVPTIKNNTRSMKYAALVVKMNWMSPKLMTLSDLLKVKLAIIHHVLPIVRSVVVMKAS